jgi:hypothetical protein
MCSQLEFSAEQFANTTTVDLCGLMVSVNATPMLAYDGDSLGLPPAGRRRAAAYVIEFTFATPVRPLSLELVGVSDTADAGAVHSLHLYGGSLNITNNVTSLVAVAPATTTAAMATTATETTAETTAAGTDTGATTTDTTSMASSDATNATTTATVEAPPATTLSVRLEIDDANVRFKTLKVQVAATATTAPVSTTSTTEARGLTDTTAAEWYLMEAGPLVLWMWLAIGGGVLLLAIIIIAVVCIVRRKGDDDDDDMEMYSHRDMSPAPVAPPTPVRSAFDEAPSSAGNTITSDSDKNYTSLNEFKVATTDALPPPPMTESRDSTYQALPSQQGSGRF